jgi:transcriptional regulator with XRE-family HTH domain
LLQTRKKAGLTQEEVAKRLGKPQSYISKCQSGERRVDIIELRAICEAMEIPLHKFTRQLESKLSEPKK